VHLLHGNTQKVSTHYQRKSSPNTFPLQHEQQTYQTSKVMVFELEAPWNICWGEYLLI
jgi:hypothetical protein